MPTMQITGADVGTIDLNDDVNCQIANPGWIPAVSRRRRGVLANRSIYEDVVETIPLRVFSEHATPATARQTVMAWVHDLASALDQVESWQENDRVVDALVFNFEADDSSLANPLRAVITGIPENAPSVLEFQGSFNNALRVFEMFIELQFVRRGAWLGNEETASSGSSSTPQQTVTFSSGVEIPSPISLDIEDGLGDFDVAELLVGHDADYMDLSGSWFSGGTNQANTNAYQNTVRRFTPSSTATQLGIMELTKIFSGGRNRRPLLYHAKLVLINNSDSVSYSINAQLNSNIAGAALGDASRTIVVPPAGGTPTIIDLGYLVDRVQVSRVNLNITPLATGGSGDALDIDYIVIGQVGTSHFISLNNVIGVGDLRTFHSEMFSTPEETELNPFVDFDSPQGPSYRLQWSGDVNIFSTGNQFSVILYGYNDVLNATDPAHTKNTQVIRRAAFLVPV